MENSRSESFVLFMSNGHAPAAIQELILLEHVGGATPNGNPNFPQGEGVLKCVEKTRFKRQNNPD